MRIYTPSQLQEILRNAKVFRKWKIKWKEIPWSIFYEAPICDGVWLFGHASCFGATHTPVNNYTSVLYDNPPN